MERPSPEASTLSSSAGNTSSRHAAKSSSHAGAVSRIDDVRACPAASIWSVMLQNSRRSSGSDAAAVAPYAIPAAGMPNASSFTAASESLAVNGHRWSGPGASASFTQRRVSGIARATAAPSAGVAAATAEPDGSQRTPATGASDSSGESATPAAHDADSHSARACRSDSRGVANTVLCAGRACCCSSRKLQNSTASCDRAEPAHTTGVGATCRSSKGRRATSKSGLSRRAVASGAANIAIS